MNIGDVYNVAEDAFGRLFLTVRRPSKLGIVTFSQNTHITSVMKKNRCLFTQPIYVGVYKCDRVLILILDLEILSLDYVRDQTWREGALLQVYRVTRELEIVGWHNIAT